jgi:4-hydroxythreonine-4-phosphate dehydrogenase
MDMTSTVPLAITMGDASGIGPEIVAKALAGSDRHAVVFGSHAVMADVVKRLKLDVAVRRIADVEHAQPRPGTIDVVETTRIVDLPPMGRISAESGQASFDSIVAAIAAAKAGKVAGIVTAPINKEALACAGIHYPGHTEILADYGGADRVAMMLANDEIRTVLVTIHMSLRKAIEQADFDAQMSAIRLAHEGGRALGIAAPRVAVAGLNPHAGEGGLFGDEEVRIIAPAIAAARAEGIDASGPYPGDTVFMQARAGRFDVVVAQYHDQGLIPVKYLGLEKGVNITLGLPFVRTSPDHGTAFDIAGRGIADHASLETAIAYATRLISARTSNASTKMR